VLDANEIMIDYHIHTLLCNHAQGAMESYIRSAINLGMKEICFLDHLTVQESEKGLSMAPEEIPHYFQAIQLLKQQYKEAIHVKAGLEIDFNPAYTDLFQEIVGTYAFDVVASALHFPGGLNIVSGSSAWAHGESNTDYVYGLYYEYLEKMLDFNYFDVICHIDLIKKFGRKPSRSFDTEFNDILLKIKTKNLCVEINTSGYNHPVREPYPSPDMISKCHNLGILITLGSDAHTPAHVGQHYDRVLPLIFSAGNKYLTTFTKRRFGKVPIK
jgi:histidinol-phosphatase (PHP family)